MPEVLAAPNDPPEIDHRYVVLLGSIPVAVGLDAVDGIAADVVRHIDPDNKAQDC